MRKFFSVVVSLLLVFSLSLSVFAEEARQGATSGDDIFARQDFDAQNLQRRDPAAEQPFYRNTTRDATNTDRYFFNFSYSVLSTAYSSANLIEYPYYTSFGSTVNGVTYTEGEQGIVYANGTCNSADGSIFVLTPFGTDVVLPAGTYFYSCLTAAGGWSSFQATVGYTPTRDGGVRSYSYDNGNGVQITLTEECRMDFRIIVRNNYTASAVEFRPMLTATISFVPYSLYFPYQIYRAEESGEVQGYQAGYDGAISDLADVPRSIFTRTDRILATYGTLGDISITLENFGNEFTSTGFQISPETWNGWNDFDPYPLSTKIRFYWSGTNRFDFESQRFLLSIYNYWFGVASADVNQYVQFYVGNADGTYQLSLLATDNANVYSVDAGQQYIGVCNYIEIRVSQREIMSGHYFVLADVNISVSGGSYQDGFAAGWLDGANSTNIDVLDRGRSLGYAEGFSAGKSEGLSIAQQGTFTNLFTALFEAPINAFQSLFSFEVLGMDMRVVFTSLLSLAVLLIILKKVVG